MNEFIVSTKGSLWECSCPECQGSRKGSRKGDALAQQIIGDNVEEDPDGYNFYDARLALKREGYSDDEIEDEIDDWMYDHMN